MPNMSKNQSNRKFNQLPSWLWTNSTILPPVYKVIWEAVREDRVRSNVIQSELLVDTNKVFPLLLTSQLPTGILGHIWSLANQKYAGQLTQQELYIVLALIAAAQTSYTFNSLDVLHLFPFPPTPYLNAECIMNLQSTVQVNSQKAQYPNNEESNISKTNVEIKHMSDVKGKAKARPHGDTVPDVNISSSNIMPGKLSCLDQLSSTIGNNSFNDGKPIVRDIPSASSFDESSDEFTEFQSAPTPNISIMPIWGSKQGSAIGSRLANHNLGVKKPIEKPKKTITGKRSMHLNHISESASLPYQNKDHLPVETFPSMFPKCIVKSHSQTVILKDTVIRNEETTQDHSDSLNNLASMTEALHLSNDKDVSSKMELSIKAVEVSDSVQQDLMNLQLFEDRYSALRTLVQETSVTNDSDLNEISNNQSADEFGEFISAEQTNHSNPDILETESFSNVFTDLEFNPNANVEDNSLMNLNFASGISESFDNLKLDDGVESQLTESGKKEDAISINSVELINGLSETLPRSGSVPSLDLKLFLPSNLEEDQVVEASQQTMYWEWKQYMESCVLLLQVAANIFTNITSDVILHEVLSSAQGYNFLCYLAEVAAVCRRVNFSYKELDINITGFDDLLLDIDRIWAEMEPFYANIPIVTELPAWPLHQRECMSCSLCLTVITSGRAIYNENNYHITCANLWLNCVNNQLPVMRYTLLYPQSNICPDTHI